MGIVLLVGRLHPEGSFERANSRRISGSKRRRGPTIFLCRPARRSANSRLDSLSSSSAVRTCPEQRPMKTAEMGPPQRRKHSGFGWVDSGSDSIMTTRSLIFTISPPTVIGEPCMPLWEAALRSASAISQCRKTRDRLVRYLRRMASLLRKERTDRIDRESRPG